MLGAGTEVASHAKGRLHPRAFDLMEAWGFKYQTMLTPVALFVT
jgi:hypothetical protein